MSKRNAIGLGSNDQVPMASEAADSSGLSDNELSKILSAVSAMMTASGQRQSTAMQDMRQRITELSDEARDVSQSLPVAHRDSFQRIADAMCELADRVSEGREHHQRSDQPTMSTTPDSEPREFGQAEVSPPQINVSTRIAAPSHSPAAAIVENAAQSGQAVEFFANPEDPWDEASAEQLTRLYEDSGLDHQFYSTPDVAVSERAVPVFPPLAAKVEENTGDAPSPSGRAGITPQDKTWLSSQFSEIAANIELNSAGSDRYDTAINSIEQRLDALEGLVRTAVQDGATRSDVASLADIETVIFEFAAQFEKTQAELVRIERLEAEITTLASRLSEERVEAMASVTTQSTDPVDAERIAEFVASRVAEQSARAVAEALLNSPDQTTTEVADLKDLLNNLIAEHRNDGQETTDRLESIETSVKELLERADTTGPAMRQEASLSAPLPEYTDMQSGPAGSMQPRSLSTAPIVLDHPDADDVPSVSASVNDLVDGMDEAHFPLDDASVHLHRDPTIEQSDDIAPDEQEGQGDNPTAAASAPPQQTLQREDFMAQARRAAAKANERAEMQGVEAAHPQMRRAGGATSGMDAKPRPSRIRVALAALAVIVLAFGGTSLVLGWSGHSITSLLGLSYKNVNEAPAKVAEPPKPKPASRRDRSPVATPSQARDGLRTGQPLPVNSVTQAVPTSLNPSLPPTEVDQTSAALANPSASRKLPPAQIGPLSLRLAAADGNSSAAFEVGARFAEGKGIKQDFQAAANWYTRSAAAGFALAQYRLATLYERGLGVEKDVSRAKIWYERAAKQGNIKAMHNLAVLSAGANGGQADYGTAARWFAEAAERGLADSQFNLAILYQNGLGVGQDLELAFQWFSIAAQRGDNDANQRRESLQQDLTPATADKLNAVIASWRPRPTSRSANDAGYAGALWRSQSTASSSSE